MLQTSKVYSVSGDGHCLLHSWEVALVASNKTKFKTSYDVLHNLIYMEFQNNKDRYSEFLVSDYIDKEIKKYLHEKIYSSEIGDIIFNILANSTSTEAHIYLRNKKNEFPQPNFIEPRGLAVNGDVHLLKSGEHYESVVPRSYIGLRK